MKRIYIILIVIILLIGLILFVVFTKKDIVSTNQEVNISNNDQLDNYAALIEEMNKEDVEPFDFQANFMNLSNIGLQMISLYPAPKQQIINTDGKQVSEKDLSAESILNEDTKLSWSKDGNYLVIVNQDVPLVVFDLKNNKKIKELSPNIKLATEVIGDKFYYWYLDSENKINNISASAISTNDWQALGDVPENKKLSSLTFSPDGSNLIFSTFSDEEMDERLYTINLQSKKVQQYQGPFSPQRVSSINQYLVIEYLNEKIEKELAVLDKNSWQDFSKAKVIKGQQFLAVKSDKDQEIGIIIEERDDKMSLRLIPSDKTYNVKELFKNRSFAVPDSDIVADFSALTFADIKNAVIFQNNFYLQIGNGIYKAKL